MSKTWLHALPVVTVLLAAQEPQIQSVSPLYGPVIGGTAVTIRGQLLGNSSQVPAVSIGNVTQNVTEKSVVVTVTVEVILCSGAAFCVFFFLSSFCL